MSVSGGNERKVLTAFKESRSDFVDGLSETDTEASDDFPVEGSRISMRRIRNDERIS